MAEDTPIDAITTGEVYRVLGRVEKSLDQKVSFDVYNLQQTQTHEDIVEIKADILSLKVEVQKFAIKVAAMAAAFNTAVIAAQWYLVIKK